MKSLQFDSLVISDRDIIDLLDAQKSKISKDKLLKFLRERGVFCSKDDSREILHEAIASLSIDWFLIEDILSLAASKETTQKMTSTNFSIIDAKALETTLEDLKNELEHKDFIVDKLNNGNYEIQYKVDNIEKSNARLIQRSSKDEKIFIDVNGDKATLINSIGSGTDSVVNKFFNKLESNSKAKIDTLSIDFSSISDSEIINQFFIQLIRLDNKRVHLNDVMKLRLNRLDSSEDKELSLENIDVNDSSHEDDGDDDLSKEDIKSALISGSSLLSSNVFQTFERKGYFISSITWLVSEKSGKRRKIEYSAGFTDPSRTTFTYESKGYFELSDITHDHKKNRTSWKKSEKKTIEKTFQKFAFDLFDNITQELK